MRKDGEPFTRPAQPALGSTDNPAMRFHHIAPGHGVLELDWAPTPAVGKGEPPALDLELLVWWGGDEPTRAAWVLSQTGRVAGWAVVGQA